MDKVERSNRMPKSKDVSVVRPTDPRTSMRMMPKKTKVRPIAMVRVTYYCIRVHRQVPVYYSSPQLRANDNTVTSS